MPNRKSKSLERTLIVILICILLVLIAIIVFGNKKEEPTEDSIPLNLVGSYDTKDNLYFQKMERKTVLLTGLNGDDVQYVLLIVIDEDNKTLQPIQINRDTVCEYNVLDEFGRTVTRQRGKIRDSFRGADDKLVGLLNVKDVVNQLMCNVRIDYYIAVDLNKIDTITDLFDGVDVELKDDYIDINPKFVRDSEVTILGDDAIAFIIGKEDEEGVERIEERINRYISGFFELSKVEHEDDKEYFAKKFAEVTKYCLLNSNDFIEYAEQTVAYKQLPLIVVNGTRTSEGMVLDTNDIEKVCLENIYK